MAKIETSVTVVKTRSSANEPMIAMPPTSAGSVADTMLPNTTRHSSTTIGMVSDSARAMSAATWSPTSLNTAVGPPACSVSPGASRSSAIRS